MVVTNNALAYQPLLTYRL